MTDMLAIEPHGSMILVEGMRKSYGGLGPARRRTVAVRDLSMHVPRGSIYGFVGPNGAGKTTTIRTLATLQRADAGRVEVAGIDVAAAPGAVRDRVGYMPDFFGVYDNLTVGEYLDFYGASHRIPARRLHQLCNELLELVDLTDKRDEPVQVLSRGMKQRLGLARCLVHDPEVLLLDEPASGMDPRARIELREILGELRNLGKTILVSSHILPELAEMCTHIGIINGGELIAEGAVDEVIGRLAGGTRLRVRLLDSGSIAAAAAVLSAHPSCRGVEAGDADGLDLAGGRTLLAEFAGGDADLADLLREMVAAGVPVTDFARQDSTLEDVFLRITQEGPDGDPNGSPAAEEPRDGPDPDGRQQIPSSGVGAGDA